MHLASNGLIPHILLNVIFLVHELDKVCWIHIWLQLPQDLVKLRMLFVFAIIFIYAHLFLHAIIVIGHEISHFTHDLVFSLSLNGLLVVLQLSRKQISLSILELNCLLFSLGFVREARYLRQVLTSPVLDFIRVDEPNIVIVVFQEFDMHLQYFDLSNFL